MARPSAQYHSETHPTDTPVEMLNLNPGQFVLLKYNFDTKRGDSSVKKPVAIILESYLLNIAVSYCKMISKRR